MAQRDQGMRMLINDEEDEEDDEDEDEDDDDDVDAADDGDDGDDDDEEGEMMTLYQPEISSRGGGLGRDQGGIEPRPAGGEGGELESFHVSNGPAPCLFLAKARATSLAQLMYIASCLRVHCCLRKIYQNMLCSNACAAGCLKTCMRNSKYAKLIESWCACSGLMRLSQFL